MVEHSIIRFIRAHEHGTVLRECASLEVATTEPVDGLRITRRLGLEAAEVFEEVDSLVAAGLLARRGGQLCVTALGYEVLAQLSTIRD